MAVSIGERPIATTDNGQSSGKKVLILAGEASGDLQAAHLAEALWKLDPTLRIMAFGGVRLRSAGVEIIEDPFKLGVVGLWDVITHLPAIYALFLRARRRILQERPDLLILIDSPGMNLRLAAFARQHNIPTLYYFPPSAWSPNPQRARRVGGTVDYVVAAFSYTVDSYRRAGQPIQYFGHPLIDIVQPPPSISQAREQLGLPPAKRYVGLLPGSRRPEVHRLGPIIFEAARLLHQQMPDVHFAVPVALPELRDLVASKIAVHGGTDLPITLTDGAASTIMAVSDLLIMSSGSASLEAAILGTPMVLLYRLATPDWWLAHFVLHDYTYMGLPNLISQKLVVPELLQDEATPQRILQEALSLLSDEARRQQMKDNLLQVKNQLGHPGVVARVAQYIWEIISDGPGRSHHHE